MKRRVQKTAIIEERELGAYASENRLYDCQEKNAGVYSD